MPGRQMFRDGQVAFSGQNELDFSFLLNGAGAITIANPAPNALAATINYRGGGMLPGGSVVFTATGIYTVTLGLGYTFRYIVTKTADLDDTVNDGAYATLGSVTGEGTNGQITMQLITRAAAGAATTFTNRRCQILLSCKSTSGGA
jgi:hypothetical protein